MISKEYIQYYLKGEDTPGYYINSGICMFIEDCLTTSNETFLEVMEDLKVAGFDFKRVFGDPSRNTLKENCLILVTRYPYFKDEERLRRIKYLVEECGLDVKYETSEYGLPCTVLTTLSKCVEREKSMKYLIEMGARTDMNGFDVEAALRGDYVDPRDDLTKIDNVHKKELFKYIHTDERGLAHARALKKGSDSYFGYYTSNEAGDVVFVSKYGYELVFKKGEWDGNFFTHKVKNKYISRLEKAIEANGGNLLSDEDYEEFFSKFKKEVIDPAPKKQKDISCDDDDDDDYILFLERSIFGNIGYYFEPNPIIDILRKYYKSDDTSSKAWTSIVDEVKSIVDSNPEIIRGETGVQAFICSYNNEIGDIIIKEIIKRYGKEEALNVLYEAYGLTKTPVRDIGACIIENLAPMYKVIGSLYEEAKEKSIDDLTTNSLASLIEKAMKDNAHFAGTIDALRTNELSKTEKLFDDYMNGDRSNFSWSYDED